MIKLSEEQLKELLVAAWFLGHETSRYSPNTYGDAHRDAREIIEEIKEELNK